MHDNNAIAQPIGDNQSGTVIDPCLEILGDGAYRCRNTGLTFRTTATRVHCCGADPPRTAARPLIRIATPRPKPIFDAQCVACQHLMPDGRCKMFLAGCDANQRRAVALRHGCRFRRVDAREEPHIPGDTFIRTAELVRRAQALAREITNEEFDAIIGVARSGLIAAAPMAVEMHLPLFSVSPISGRLQALGSGFRLGDPGNRRPRAALLVDDTVSNGGTIKIVREKLKDIPIAATAAILVNPEHRDAVDFAGALYPQPHYLEWCFVNTFWARDMAFDFDGILCADPTCYDTDLAYERFLQDARPQYLPRMFPIAIISARCEWTRRHSMAWLARHNVRVRELVLWDGDPEARWAEPDRIARWKAEHLLTLKQKRGIRYYVESHPHQAKLIAQITGMPVVCPAASRVFHQGVVS